MTQPNNQSQLLSIPTPQQPLINFAGKDGKPLQIWWRFWNGLYVRSQATVPALLATGLTAAGTTQATAFAMSAEWNEFTTVAANTGALLYNFGAGFASFVWNAGANALKVYPPVGGSIDAIATNGAYSLAAGKAQCFSQLTAIRWRSLQLG